MDALREPESRHQIRGDLLTRGGRGRLLALAAGLLEMGVAGAAVQGRLRCWSLYQPTKSELLVGPLLSLVGEVAWQPEGARHGADYQLVRGSTTYVAEVKRLCTSKREDELAIKRIVADLGHSGPVFTPDEELANAKLDARRLYPRVRYAAKQLAQSANGVERRRRTSSALVPGILFLDLDGNRLLVNLCETICRWMNLRWARPIDLVVLFDYSSRNGVWGTIAQPIYSRTDMALHALVEALPTCSLMHFHVGNLPAGPCEFPL